MTDSHNDNAVQPHRKRAGLYVGRTADEVNSEAPDRKAINHEKANLRAMLLDAEEWDWHNGRGQLRFEYGHLSREQAHGFAVQALHDAGIDTANLRHSGVRAFVVDLPDAAYDALTAYAAAHPKPAEPTSHVSRTLRGSVKILGSAADIALYQRALNPNAWVLHGDTAYLNLPIPPLKPIESSAEVLQARTLHAELFLDKSARLLETQFGVTGVHGTINHEDGGCIQLLVDVTQYRDKIASLAQEKNGAAR